MRTSNPTGLNRRRLLSYGAVGTAAIASRQAQAFSVREMTGPEAAAYANRCGSDFTHSADIDTAIGRLREAGASFDEAALRASLVCPLCGCWITSLPPKPAG